MKVNAQKIIFKIDSSAHYSIARCLELDTVGVWAIGNLKKKTVFKIYLETSKNTFVFNLKKEKKRMISCGYFKYVSDNQPRQS